MRSDYFQITLIVLGFVASALFGVFVWREAFPEYKIYQKDYIALEDFRSTYTGEPPPEFNIGIKQIVITREDKGPPLIDRCISCHVALEYSHFSPTTIEKDINGKIVYDEDGFPKKIPNENDVWTRLDDKIEQLEKEKLFSEADQLKALKTATVDGREVDVTKVLRMHPLMGAETRPFEFHPIEEYGCTSCHNGNGLGLTSAKAHGPVFDGQYEVEFEGAVPKFNESDENNDPVFAKMYNGKPGHELIFQTSPIFVGALIQAKCMQCHLTSEKAVETAGSNISFLTQNSENKIEALQNSFNSDQETLLATIELESNVQKLGVAGTVNLLRENLKKYSLTAKERQTTQANLDFLLITVGGFDGLRPQNAQPAKDVVLEKINESLKKLLGDQIIVDQIKKNTDRQISGKILSEFIVNHQNEKIATGLIFKKLRKLSSKVKNVDQKIEGSKNLKNLNSSIDVLTKNFQRGEQLFVSQSCYACHKIAGVSRGGVGPELTEIGKGYPWFIKQKLVWPQATLRNSTMPNYHLDHYELEDLMTFLLAQTGSNQSVSESAHKLWIKDWEAGKKTALEKPLKPSEIHDVRNSMTIFATEGCAACHRLEGFESDVGFSIEKENLGFDSLYKEKQWFQSLIPESIMGSRLVQVIQKNSNEIDKRIANNVRKGSILEEIEKLSPRTIESFYPNFAFAARHKNHETEKKLAKETDPVKKQEILNELKVWKERVRSTLMIYVQEYGLGRLIGPKPNWSGIYRSDEWLMQHFRNPSGLIPNSIMPVFSFDDTKFYALTYMLDILGQKNRDSSREIWKNEGFSPKLAYEIHCSSCHGDQRGGNGPIADWIYPVPKNLRNADFLRNLTKENAVNSIIHGIKGTPMAPWGEAASDKPNYDGVAVLSQDEIEKIVDWIFFGISGEKVIDAPSQVPKWNYEIKDVNEELNNEEKFQEPIKESDPLFNHEKMSSGKYGYFIKEKYYTAENIQEGKNFFEMNCAICHGKEADGTGVRGAVMLDAKPRNLTNIYWLNTKDDLSLLRSIKFGVAGTSMSAWGEQTSALQRLQLTMFIRSLNGEAELRQRLANAIYENFDSNISFLENLRGKEFVGINRVQNQINGLDSNENNDEKAIENFKLKLSLIKELDLLKNHDQKLIKLQALMKEESKIYNQIGLDFVAKQVSNDIFNPYISLISINENRFTIQNDKLTLNDILKKQELIVTFRDKIAVLIDEKIHQLQKEDGSNDSTHKIKGYEKLKLSLYSGIKTIFELIKEEEEVINQ